MLRLHNANRTHPGLYSSPARDADIQIVASRSCSGRPLFMLDVQSSRVATDGYRRREHACATLDLSDLLSLESLLRGLAIEATESIDAEAARQLDLVLA